jgi:hypothetical protein
MRIPQHYLLSRAAGLAALKKLGSKYPDPVAWIHKEQKLNDRKVSAGDYPIHPSSVPPEFWPERQPVFWLPEFEAPIDHFRLLKNPTSDLPWYLSGSTPKRYSHLVHPLTVQYFRTRGLKRSKWREPRFLATPMASHRTLLVWKPNSNIPPFVVKSSLNLWVGGLNRNVRLKELRRSVGISSLLSEIPKAALRQQGILLLDDSVGLIHKQTNAGLLARDTPWKLDAGEEVVPMFSLVANAPGKPPRIVDLIRSSGLNATAWVDRFIFTPLIYQAYFLGMTEGLIGEMHEQNILMELRDGLPTKRFWHRDLGGFLVDRNLRRLANKDYAVLPRGIHQQHLGRDIPVFHLVLGMYLKETMGYAIGQALRGHFEIPDDNFAELYDVRVRELQNVIFAADGIRSTFNFEKDLERYRQRKSRGCTWRWTNLQEALREWKPQAKLSGAL